MDCIFRFDVSTADRSETARCRLLEQIAGADDSAALRVPKGACEACLQFHDSDTLRSHPVFPSVLFQWSTEQLAADPKGSSAVKLLQLQQRAETALATQTKVPLAEPVPSIDVIFCAGTVTDLLRESIRSILDQEQVTVFVHLIDTGSASSILNEFADDCNFRAYPVPAHITVLEGLHQIIESLQGSLIAIQSPYAISDPNRLLESVRAMETARAEFFVSPIRGGDTVSVVSTCASASGSFQSEQLRYERKCELSTLVMRRSTFVDMGGVANVNDVDVEFIFRAMAEGRVFAVGKQPFVTLVEDAPLSPPGIKPAYQSGPGGVLRSFACGFPMVLMSCDVVLPFFGHLEYVTESMYSLLNQQDCKVVIHLVDDATQQDTTQFMRQWLQYPNVRIYRNVKNIGQFHSFNNIVRHCETQHIAVQDADDISLPHRLQRAGQMLHYCDADIFGGTVELFGDDHVIRPTFDGNADRLIVPRAAIRRSFYPKRVSDNYFIENPTAVFRLDMFRTMGGFADFGDRLMNRASLDAEFQQRCLFHGVRYAVSRDVVVRYRVHQNSATQDTASGWGTVARNKSGRLVQKRIELYQQGGFDPRSFGSLGRYQNVTQRLK